MGQARGEGLGGLIYGWWVLKRRLAGTERPGLARSLPVLLAATGALLSVEGVLLRKFKNGPVPAGRGCLSPPARYPMPRAGPGAARALITAAAVSGSMAGALLERRPTEGSCLAMLLALSAAGGGAVLSRLGARSRTGRILALGVADIVSGLVVSVILSLCWYSLDPLGLHGEPPAEGASGRCA